MSLKSRALVALSVGALVTAALAGCSASSVAEPNGSSVQEVPSDKIPGAEKISVRYERLQGSAQFWLYCIDNTAYLSNTVGLTEAPQYDELCVSNR